MMNLLALGLVFTSLVIAGFFNPTPDKKNAKQDVIVKEGHRVVVVEYEKDDGNTKVLISPQDGYEKGYVDKLSEKMSERVQDAKEKMKQGSSAILPDGVDKEEEISHGFSPRELVCDAYGKCKHKIASAMGKTKDAVGEKALEMDTAVTDTARRATDAASEASSRVKDKVVEKAGEMKEGAKGKVSDVIDKTSDLKEEAEESAKKKMKWAKEKVTEKKEEAEEMVEHAKDRASKVKKEGQKELSEIMRHGREVAGDVFRYVAPVGTLSGVLHLMGFASAYGMCIWVTFASSYVLAGALPRNMFAIVQSKIYPLYFKAMAYSVGMALLGHLMGLKRFSPFSVGMLQSSNLLSSLALILVNLLYLEPRATKVLFERMKKEKEEGRGKESHTTDTIGGARVGDPLAEVAGRVTTGVAATKDEAAVKSEIFRLSEILRRLNSYSSFLNILTLMSLTWHLVHLGQRVHVACET